MTIRYAHLRLAHSRGGGLLRGVENELEDFCCPKTATGHTRSEAEVEDPRATDKGYSDLEQTLCTPYDHSEPPPSSRTASHEAADRLRLDQYRQRVLISRQTQGLDELHTECESGNGPDNSEIEETPLG